jgi:lipoprotein-anchoring transpeptidase ErfK/SrfK
MEVLVSRLVRRVSRPLIVVLAAAVCIGAVSITYKISHRAPAVNSALAANPAQQSNSASASLSPLPADHSPALAPVDETIGLMQSGSTTRPAPIIADSPATKPSEIAVAPAIPAPSAVLASQIESSPTTVPSTSLLSQAKAQVDAGRLLEARAKLNDALQSGRLDDAQAAPLKSLISQINQTLVFGRQHVRDDIYSSLYVVKSGDTLAKIAGEHDCTWELLSRINGVQPKFLRAGATIKVIEGPFCAVVTKSKFTMDIYLGGLPGEKSSMYVTTYPVGLGRDDSTPLGTWSIEPRRKLKHPTYYSPRGEGIIPADDPKNPLGGYWIGLTGSDGEALGKLSYGIHGTIEPDSIGKQSSMGCIRLRNEDIAVVYDLMTEGRSLVVVKQ